MADDIPLDVRAALAERARIATFLRLRGAAAVTEIEAAPHSGTKPVRVENARAANYTLCVAADAIDRGEQAGIDVSETAYKCPWAGEYVLVRKDRFQAIATAEAQLKRLMLFEKAKEEAERALQPYAFRKVATIDPHHVDRILSMLQSAFWGKEW